jgi:hypothetical protein
MAVRVVNLESGGVLSSFWVQFCQVDSQHVSGNVTGGKQLTGDDGLATLDNIAYPNDGKAYAYYAVPACGHKQHKHNNGVFLPVKLGVGPTPRTLKFRTSMCS